MLLSILAWVIISFICYTWGFITCRMFSWRKAVSVIHFPSFSLICMTGLSLIGITGLYLSLLLPLNVYVQVFFIIPAFICWLIPPFRNVMLTNLQESFRFSSAISFLLITLCLLMILVISSYHIIHPDTLSYHLQSIRWFESFKAVPGIVHIDQELGLQSLWFGAHAIFRPKFIEYNFVIFLNGAVLCWFFIFIRSYLDFKLNIKKHIFLALMLLTFSLFSWTQVRLTAASASPDFIVCLYILAAAYLFLHPEKEGQRWNGLIILFSVTAVSIKLSSVAVMLLPLSLIITSFRKKQNFSAFRAMLLSILLLLPILIRNSIASGYPLFPSSGLDMLNVSWKQDDQKLAEFREYIKTYARIADDTESMGYWVFTWWDNLSIADQSLLILLLLLLSFSIFRARRIVQQISSREVWLLVTSITGIILWWVYAPDPRFITGFLLLLTMLLAGINLKSSHTIFNNRILLIYSWLVITCITGYTITRFNRFFEVDQLLFPKGVAIGNFKTVTCYTIPMNVPVNDTLCGGIPVPCLTDSCTGIIPLGKTIEDGFSSSKQ